MAPSLRSEGIDTVVDGQNRWRFGTRNHWWFWGTGLGSDRRRLRERRRV